MRRELELYFHIPFCVQKCYYCDFLSAPADEATKGKYMEALLTEMVGSAKAYREYCVTSVFIGGGTPSVVNVAELERLMEAIRANYHLSEAAEITMEVNPGTVDRERVFRYRRAGINRLSIGLQSANNGELQRIGRVHSWEQFVETFRVAREAGFDNLNVDVMSALPGQTTESYRETLEKLLALEEPPEHISAYSLILEEGTRFYEMYQHKELEPVDEEVDREMYCVTGELLGSRGYHRYEISNYARPGYECRHNVGYWKRTEYVGFGIGAASLVGNVRFQNGRDIWQYIHHPMECRENVQELSIGEQMEEFMFLGLRMTAGVKTLEFQQSFGVSLREVYGEIVDRNVRDGLLELVEAEEVTEKGSMEEMQTGTERLALTKRGLDVSNYVMAQFLK